jgi:hypothetical protein
MRFLATYVARGPLQATLVVAVSALLSLILPPLGYLGGAAVSLVTLRMGWRQGLLLILGAMIVTGLLGMLLIGNPLAGVIFGLTFWLPLWVMAVSLRRTANLVRSLLLGALFGVVTVLLFHSGTADPAKWWFDLLQEALQKSITEMSDAERVQFLQNLKVIAGLMTGGAAAVLSASLIGCLLLGRWWQALLYNPGGFGEEFRSLRLGRSFTLGFLAVLLFFALGVGGLLFQNIFVVLLVPFVIQALAVAHTLVRVRKVNNGWLAALYLLLVVANGHMLLLLGFFGAMDNWFDFRRLFAHKGGADNS